MGTQQILMIVLSVIIVGTAVSVGIEMFDVQATNSQRTAIAGDLQSFGAHTLAYFRTPVSIAGGQGAPVNIANLADYLGFKLDDGAYTFKNANGIFTITVTTPIANESVISIRGIDSVSNQKIDLTATITQETNNVLVQKTT